MRTRIFKNGNSLAIRLPAELAMPEGEVEIERRDDEIVIRPIKTNLSAAWEAFNMFSDDFMTEGREQPSLQERRFDLG
jgi:antitoxin VapB